MTTLFLFLKENSRKIIITLFFFMAALPGFVSAQDTSVGLDIANQLQSAGGSRGAGLGQPTDPRITVLLIIRTSFQVIGLLVFLYMLYAGFRWMTAGGNDEQISESKKIIRNCVIGLIIIMSAYSLTYFIITVALGATADNEPSAVLFY